MSTKKSITESPVKKRTPTTPVKVIKKVTKPTSTGATPESNKIFDEFKLPSITTQKDSKDLTEKGKTTSPSKPKLDPIRVRIVIVYIVL